VLKPPFQKLQFCFYGTMVPDASEESYWHLKLINIYIYMRETRTHEHHLFVMSVNLNLNLKGRAGDFYEMFLSFLVTK